MEFGTGRIHKPREASAEKSANKMVVISPISLVTLTLRDFATNLSRVRFSSGSRMIKALMDAPSAVESV